MNQWNNYDNKEEREMISFFFGFEMTIIIGMTIKYCVMNI